MALGNPTYITPSDGSFKYHTQNYQFGALEFAGAEDLHGVGRQQASQTHMRAIALPVISPPDFSDFVFHNSGAAQAEYDAVNGAGAFLISVFAHQIPIASANFNAYLPASSAHTCCYRGLPPRRGRRSILNSPILASGTSI